MMFFPIYNTDENILIGAPTGSGKTLMADLAIIRTLKQQNGKILYIAPFKSLIKEKLAEWEVKFGDFVKVVELSGESSPNVK